jgi:hypothetical protein
VATPSKTYKGPATEICGLVISSVEGKPIVGEADCDDPLADLALQRQPCFGKVRNASHSQEERFHEEQFRSQSLKEQVEYCDGLGKSDG